jgi:hypothetical protein
MTKLTLLEIVQKVLSSTDGDEVNSINDTVEALQVANTVEDVFYNMVVNHDIPEHEGLIRLEALADADVPNYLKLPARVTEITGVKYDKSEDADLVEFRDIHYRNPTEFLSVVTKRNADEDNVEQVADPVTGVILLVINDKHPQFWTSFDDEYMVFDSYHSDYDDTLQAHKTMVIAKRLPTFSLEDDFIPDMDDNLFPLLLNEVKSWVYLESKQTSHPKAEQSARKQKAFYQSQRNRIGDQNKNNRPDYGRRR